MVAHPVRKYHEFPPGEYTRVARIEYVHVLHTGISSFVNRPLALNKNGSNDYEQQ